MSTTHPEHMAAARDIARNVVEYYIRDEPTDWTRRRINHDLAALADEIFNDRYDAPARITTTHHDEKVVVSLPGRRRPLQIGSYGETVDHHVMRWAYLPEDDFCERVTGWSLGKAEKIVEEAAELVTAV